MFHPSGARKKKSLTDLVKIIPFPNQNLRDKVTTKVVNKPEVKPPSLQPVEKVAPRVMTAPSGKLNSSSLSIKQMMEKKEEENNAEGVDLSNMPRESFSMDDLKMLWRRFAFQMKDEGRDTFYNALIKRDPKATSETSYDLEVDNQVQVDYIRPYLSDLLGFLRKELKNYDLNVDLKMTSTPDTEIKFQTGKDKFASLARKNPYLHTLKTTFNLDIEY